MIVRQAKEEVNEGEWAKKAHLEAGGELGVGVDGNCSQARENFTFCL
jgi:hypothetical protein